MFDAIRPALARLSNGVLALDATPGALAWADERAARVLRGDIGGEPSAQAWRDCEAGVRRPYEVSGGVAIIGVHGLIVPALGWIGSRWATGCEELRWQVRAAAEDADVRGIALVVDSGGGYVAGVDETAAAIREARVAKPVIAAAQSAYSAAYWIASAADQITAPRTGGVGSIGVIGTHFDFSAMLEAEGIRATVIHSGARKADASPLRPLADDARADIQARMDDMRRVFAASVSEGRRGLIDAAAVLATEARAFDGPAGIDEARSLGLIDAVLPAEEAVSLFAGHLAGVSG